MFLKASCLNPIKQYMFLKVSSLNPMKQYMFLNIRLFFAKLQDRQSYVRHVKLSKKKFYSFFYTISVNFFIKTFNNIIILHLPIYFATGENYLTEILISENGTLACHKTTRKKTTNTELLFLYFI